MAKKGFKKARVETDKLIVAIIVAIVIVIVVIGAVIFFRSGGYDKINSLLPDYLKANATAPEYIPCPDGFTNIGYIDSGHYININGKKTNLRVGGKDFSEIYLERKKSFLLMDLANDPKLGLIEEGVIDIEFPSNLDLQVPEYRDLYPEEKDRRLLNGAKIYEGNLCLSNSLIGFFGSQDECTLTCAIADGICSKIHISGKVAYKQLNCLDDEICYVDETEEKIISQNLAIDNENSNLYRFISSNNPTRVSNIIKSTEFTFTIPERDRISISVSYSTPFCYALDNDNPDLIPDLNYEELPSDNKVESGPWPMEDFEYSYSGEKFIHFIAWTKDGKQKVIKRWKINSNGFGSQYEDGTIINDKEFYGKIVDAKIGSIMYIIGLKREWGVGAFYSRNSKTKVTYDYKIVRDSKSKISISAHDTENKEWHQLYCNKEKDSSAGSAIKTFFNPWYSSSIGDDMTFSGYLDYNCRWAY